LQDVPDSRVGTISLFLRSDLYRIDFLFVRGGRCATVSFLLCVLLPTSDILARVSVIRGVTSVFLRIFHRDSSLDVKSAQSFPRHLTQIL